MYFNNFPNWHLCDPRQLWLGPARFFSLDLCEVRFSRKEDNCSCSKFYCLSRCLLLRNPAPLQTLDPDCFARECEALVSYLSHGATPPCKTAKVWKNLNPIVGSRQVPVVCCHHLGKYCNSRA